MNAAWRCRVCAASPAPDAVAAWRCPNAGDGREHVLAPPTAHAEGGTPLAVSAGDPTWRAFGERLAWAPWAQRQGLDAKARAALLAELDDAVRRGAGRGFVVTPFGRDAALSDALGFQRTGGVWLKDETGAVGGSHKARHLFSILAHLFVAERVGRAPWRAGTRPELVIASCGNAAIAAATLAGAVQWPIRVFVPEWASSTVTDTLHGLGARVERCARVADDPPGDPCVYRARRAVAAGAVPFGVQGPDNAWCLDSGRSLGWEIAAQLGGQRVEHVLAQTGGGAFGSCLFAGLSEGGCAARMHVVQTAACAPFARAVRAAERRGWVGAEPQHWDELMTVWQPLGDTAATGILDDETYDWLSLLEPMRATGGLSVVVDEADVIAAAELVQRWTSIAASATGTAGLAGVLQLRRSGAIGAGDNVVVVISGVAR